MPNPRGDSTASNGFNALASLNRGPNVNATVRLVGSNAKRRSLRLGEVPKKSADSNGRVTNPKCGAIRSGQDRAGNNKTAATP